jgi:hypothetical protein
LFWRRILYILRTKNLYRYFPGTVKVTTAATAGAAGERHWRGKKALFPPRRTDQKDAFSLSRIFTIGIWSYNTLPVT